MLQATISARCNVPKLMNGQVSVEDAYQQAAQALSMAAEDAAGYGKKK